MNLDDPQFAGFWRRLGAFLVDMFVLGVVGIVLGYPFHDHLAHLGPWGRLLGFSVAGVYFGLMNGAMAGGRTLGKRMLGLKVVDRDGASISTPKSFVRFLPLGLPYFLNNLQAWPSVFQTQ